ncbi:hypothetical protein TrVE_jg13422 [Triparma verrucosa]|uniref:Kinesin motor domain-containing protein n=1 Tax=Triparma verrucosa TaxID=1606542 RepID=A0A9W7C2Q6_9STRA|nr:hypothetical protein TrVE_jg13422 [Triparma verrucosa]
MDRIVSMARAKNAGTDGSPKSRWGKLKAHRQAAVAADSDNVIVAVRIRPFNSIELAESDTDPAFKKVGKQMIREVHHQELAGIQGKEYVYDHVFGPKNGTSTVYERVAKPIIEKAMEGFNGTIFAYGQTSSGKTHTLMGNAEDPGITLQTISEVFALIAVEKNTEFLVRISYIEIYNEEIKDLLDTTKTKTNLRIKDDKKKGPIVEGLTEAIVRTPEESERLIKRGEGNRSYGSTAMNATSSRSHVLFKMVVESRAVSGGGSTQAEPMFATEWSKDRPPVREAAINLVDLAGSERRGKTGATGQRAKEGNAINSSLLTLGTVISKLAEGGRGSHIPYRDSKLTRLLQTSLGGNAKTAMIAAISPAERNRDETTSTLRYASRAKQIVNHASKNIIEDEESMLAQAQNEITRLNEELEKAKGTTVVDEKTALEAKENKERLDFLNKAVMIGTQMASSNRHIGNKQKAKEIEEDLRAVAAGKRRAQSIYNKQLQQVSMMPINEQKKVFKLDRDGVGKYVPDLKNMPLEELAEDDEDEDFDILEMKKQIQEKEDKLIDLESEVTESKMTINEMEMTQSELRHNFQMEQNTSARLKNEASSVEAELNLVKKALDDAETKIKEKTNLAKEVEERAYSAESEIASQRQRVSLLENELKEKEKWVKKKDEQHEEKVHSMMQEAEEALKSHHSTVENLRADVEKEVTDRRNVERKLAESKLEMDHLSQELNSVKYELSTEQSSLSQLHEELKDERTLREKTSSSLRENLNAAEKKSGELSNELSNTKLSLKDVKQNFDQVKLDHAKASADLKTTREELRGVKEESEKASREAHRTIENNKRELSELTHNIDRITKSKTSELENLNKQITRLNSLLEEEKANSEKMKKEKNDIVIQKEEDDTQFNIKLDKALSELATEVQAREQADQALATLKVSNDRESSRHSAEIESLNEDLEEEKRRVSTANNEKARVHAEVDSLKRRVEKYASDIEAVNSNLNVKSEEYDEMARELRSTRRKLEVANESASEEKKRADMSEEKVHQLDHVKEGVTKELQDALKLHSDLLKDVVALKKDLQHAKDDLAESNITGATLKEKLELSEDVTQETSRIVSEKEAEINKLNGEISRIKEYEDSNIFMASKLRKFEGEIQRMLEDVGSSRKAQLEAESALTEHQLKAQRFEDQVISLQSDLEAVSKETRILRETLDTVRATSTAKDEAAEAAQRRSEVANAGKKAIEEELEDLRERFAELGRGKRAMESESMAAKRECDAMAIDLEETKNKLRRLENDYAEALQNVAVGEEVAVLRNQLTSLRGQLLNGGEEFDPTEEVYDENGNLMITPNSPRKLKLSEKAALEHKREKEGYEMVISKLRAELMDEANTRKKLIGDLHAAKRDATVGASIHGDLEASRVNVRRLEEKISSLEVELAKSRRNEVKAIATGGEAERNLDRASDDQSLLRGELKDAKEQIMRERARADRYAHDLAEAERKAAELEAMKSRAEAIVETSNHESDVKTRALNALKIGEEETLGKLSELQKDYSLLKEQHGYLDEKSKQNDLDLAALQNEVERWKEVASLAEKELKKEDFEVSNMGATIKRLVDDLKSANEYKEQQAKMIVDLQDEITKVRKGMREGGGERMTDEITKLSRDLAVTMNDWGEAERRRADREDRLVELKAGLLAEKEKNDLLVTQQCLLEDQLSLAREELAVFRQIDVYENSVKREWGRNALSSSTSSSRKRFGGMTTPVGKGRVEQVAVSSPMSLIDDIVGGGLEGSDEEEDIVVENDEEEQEEEEDEEFYGGGRRGGRGAREEAWAIRRGGGKGGNGRSSDEDEDNEDVEPFSRNQLAQAKQMLLERQKRGGRGKSRGVSRGLSSARR